MNQEAPPDLSKISHTPLTFKEMHSIISQEMRALKVGAIGTGRANTTCNQVGKINALVKTELTAVKLCGGKPTEVLKRIQG
jgi:hypothetical protein